MMRNDEFTYTQFTESTFDQAVEQMMFNGGPAMFEYQKKKQQQKEAEQLKQQKQYS